ncbi:MAG TPA: DUF72 domain-containing protein [Jatrophihabitantaceae bacterium]|nr:DUF72 domain-containing protein [Jatrophihabitantaceae bacterium]
MPGVARVGISGWTYPPWRGVFYPRGLPHRRELEYVAEQLSTVEINGSFYALQKPSSYLSWYQQTPAEFVFSVKGGRFITHMKKLSDVETPLANFFASGLLALREKLGPILWQLPPTLGFDADRLRRFFALLPRSSGEAMWLARRHDERMKDRALTDTDIDRPMRHALEVRHRSFLDPGFVPLLREHGIAVVVADTAGKWPLIPEVTADFVYVRLHGDKELYTSGYSEPALDRWATLIRRWTGDGAAERDAFVYFDNDVKVKAPFDALALAERLR